MSAGAQGRADAAAGLPPRYQRGEGWDYLSSETGRPVPPSSAIEYLYGYSGAPPREPYRRGEMGDYLGQVVAYTGLHIEVVSYAWRTTRYEPGLWEALGYDVHYVGLCGEHLYLGGPRRPYGREKERSNDGNHHHV